ncbi:hypothetical protein RHMOL_Rhmol02G0082700 [Rhododendron molle]|uniref:Uncharacterized protein n=1 Tax=Rhododendron molle TaxID=49168 RepID=A0ACC0PMX3_RHOML|nr:hypothetical protein RHMOL_Rhmol02G0082700 [Rhododendron molle]
MSEVVEILQNALALHERQEGQWESMTKAYTILWKGNSSNNGGGLPKQSFPEQIFESQKSVYPRFLLAEIRAATNDFNDSLLMREEFPFRLYKGCMVRGIRAVIIKRFESKVANLAGQRLEICIDTARGLVYLHTNVEQQFVHCNLNPSNVLLDDKCVAKVAAFELSVPISTRMATKGVETNNIDAMEFFDRLVYLDPEYQLTGSVTKKTDVYAFGVVLLEVLCAKTPISHNRNSYEVCLVHWFRLCIKRGNIDEVIDPYLIGKVAPECLRHYVNIALSCLVSPGIQRPSMNDVLRGLESSLQMQEAWGNSVQMGTDELHMADVPQSYNDVISVESEFTIGRQSYLISNLIRPPVH